MLDYDRILPLQTTKAFVKNPPLARQSCLQTRRVMIERLVMASFCILSLDLSDYFFRIDLFLSS
jgi:hypothetical protein